MWPSVLTHGFQGYRGSSSLCVVFLSSAVRDMQQMYELWLQLTNQSRRTDSSAVTPPPEDKQVTITADYTENMVSCSNAIISVKPAASPFQCHQVKMAHYLCQERKSITYE